MTVVERLRNRGVTPRAVLYARFSSDNQREESIEAQLVPCMSIAAGTPL